MADRVHDLQKLKVFISYSRDDLKFADQLVEGLTLTGFDPLIELPMPRPRRRGEYKTLDVKRRE